MTETSKVITLLEVIEGDLSDLLQMHGGSFESLEAELYHSILLDYLRGDIESLYKSIDRLKKSSIDSSMSELVIISDFRYFIRTHKLDSMMAALNDLSWTHMKNSWLRGELYFVLSSMAAILDFHEIARNYSWIAAKEYKQIGALKKSTRSLMNAFSSECAYRPKKNYLSDLFFIYKEAKRAGDSISIGTTLANISREYQKLGLFMAALKYAHKALAVFSNHNAGGVDYHLLLVHRAHIHCQMGAFYEAKIDAEMALACSFSEVHSALAIVANNYAELAQSLSLTTEAQAPFNWHSRKGEGSPIKASKHESQLIELLSKRSYSKRELCVLLYGDKLETSIIENRFHNLLNRIKKRNSTLISCQNSMYFLTEAPTSNLYFSELTPK